MTASTRASWMQAATAASSASCVSCVLLLPFRGVFSVEVPPVATTAGAVFVVGPWNA